MSYHSTMSEIIFSRKRPVFSPESCQIPEHSWMLRAPNSDVHECSFRVTNREEYFSESVLCQCPSHRGCCCCRRGRRQHQNHHPQQQHQSHLYTRRLSSLILEIILCLMLTQHVSGICDVENLPLNHVTVQKQQQQQQQQQQHLQRPQHPQQSMGGDSVAAFHQHEHQRQLQFERQKREQQTQTSHQLGMHHRATITGVNDETEMNSLNSISTIAHHRRHHSTRHVRTSPMSQQSSKSAQQRLSELLLNSESNNHRPLPSLDATAFHRSSSHPHQQQEHQQQHHHRSAAELLRALGQSLECRTEWGSERLSFDTYALDTCARCYHYMPKTAFKPNAKFSYLDKGVLAHFNETLTSNETAKLALTFVSPSLVFKWRQCCTDALVCCINNHRNLLEYSLRSQLENVTQHQRQQRQDQQQQQCPPTWDGWLCWENFAPPDSVQEQPCPKHIYWHQIVPPCRGYVTKYCNASGTWYVNDDGKEWSNYSMCARDDIYARRIEYSLVTNVISICALVPALIIFTHYKQLSSMSRIRLHKHLFTSLLLHAIISALLKWNLLQSTFSQSHTVEHQHPQQLLQLQQGNITLSSSSFIPSAPSSSYSERVVRSLMGALGISGSLPSFCMALAVLQRYFRSTNYLWMFNEALYLHQLIKRAFSHPSLRPLIVLAYLLPALTTGAYIVARFTANSQLPLIDDDGTLSDSPATVAAAAAAAAAAATAAAGPTSSADDGDWPIDSHNYGVENGELPSAIIHGYNTNEMWAEIVSKNELENDHRLHRAIQSLPRTFVDLLPEIYLGHKSIRAQAQIDGITNGNSYGGEGGTQPGQGHDTQRQNALNQWESSFEDVSPLFEDDACWLMPSHESWHEWIINVPNLAILIINCFFLLWLLRVLCLKAAATIISNSSSSRPMRRRNVQESNNNNNNNNNNNDTQVEQQQHLRPSQSSTAPNDGNGELVLSTQTSETSRTVHFYQQQSIFSRQSVAVSLRAAALLLPLYGLHYLVIVYRPKIENCFFSELYHYFSLSLDGLQGLAISIIFCFANGEIRHLLTRTLQRVGTRQRSTTIYMTDVAHPNHHRDAAPHQS